MENVRGWPNVVGYLVSATPLRSNVLTCPVCILVAQERRDPNFPIATETLLFTATGRDAWNPPLLNVYDKTSGELLRAIELPSTVRALPMTYLHDGTQYLAVGIGSGRDPDEIVALAIP